MFKTLTRVTTPFIALGLGFALYPKSLRKSSLQDRKLIHINDAVIKQIESTPEFIKLNSDPTIVSYNSSHQFPEQHKNNYVGSGLLFGPDLFEIDPIVFIDEKKGELASFYHLGEKMISQDGQIHNGVISTILDEGLCACGFLLLPSKKGVTAKLSINFENQAPPGSTVILRAKVKESKGRRVTIVGYIETLPLSSNEMPLRIANSECVLVEPKWFKYFSWLQVF